jgi:CHAT domain-containing protein
MADMHKTEQQIYLELVYELLNCPSGEEQNLLATKSELVNEQLVEMMLDVAELLCQRDGEEQGSNAGWLENFALRLAAQLGLEIGAEEQDDSEDCDQADLDFLNALIEAEQNDSKQVQQLFTENLYQLNPRLGAIMKWLLARVVNEEPENAEAYAAVIGNITIELSEFPLGNRAQNMEIVIAGYTAILTVRTKKVCAEKWAQTQHNLANAYSNRISGNRAQNLDLAIAGYESALEIYSQQDFLLQWAITQNNLANAYCNRISGDRAQNLDQAIAGYKSALEIYNPHNLPIDWAMTQNNLAIAYRNRTSGDLAQNLDRAIAGYKSVLKIYSQQDFPIDWAQTQNNLANAYCNRVSGDGAQNLDWAISSYESALEIRTPQNLPIDCLQTARSLGDVHFNQFNWQQAIYAYETAMQAAETSRSWSVDDIERQRVLQEALSVYENAIQCAVNLKEYQRAVEYTERVRSRQLVELMASKDLYGDAQVPVEIQAYLTEYQQLNQDIDNLRENGDRIMSAAKTSRDSQALRADNEIIRSLADRKQILYDKIRTHDPVLAGQIAIAPISHSEIQKLITNAHTAILTCYSTNDHTHIFILKQNQEPELFTCTGQGWTEFQQWLIENWLEPYKQEDNSAWRDRMPLILTEIADRLQLSQLIANYLSDIQELVLVPHLLLHQIPFAALPTGKSEELLGEKFIIRSIPSCQILKYCQDRSPILTSTQGIVEDADDSLLGARYEGQKIAEIHGVREIDRLRGKSQATIANYRQLLSRVNRLHSSHHASSNLENPLESALSLADGKITLGDLLMGEKYPNLDEIFLSACETHLGKFTFTDDVATLTTGFLCIGARSVQSTLWEVDDLVTALFDIFYHEARRDLDRSRSLQAAQNKLSNLTGEEFKLYHYPKLIGYVTPDSSARIAALKQQMKELHQQQSTLNNQTEEWQELAETMKSLTQKIKSIESIPVTLQGYCTMDRPFESPFYWAGFICQGMA